MTRYRAGHGRSGTSELPSVTEQLLPLVDAARHARDVVTAVCVRWHLDHLAGSASLIVTELVGNVVDHVHTLMVLEVSVGDAHLHLAVHDGSTVLPATRGIGLGLVNSLSTEWGYAREEHGKVVWANLALTSINS